MVRPSRHSIAKAEQQIRRILKSDADHIWPVLGEEFGGDTTGSRTAGWLIPIDGNECPTHAGLPYFGTLVAFERDSREPRPGRRDSTAGVL